MEIPGIPESIPRARIVELVEALGLDIRDLRSFSVTVHGVEAEVFARDEHGRHILAETIVTHRIAVPIKDGPDLAEVGRSVVETVRKYEGRDDNPPEPQPA